MVRTVLRKEEGWRIGPLFADSTNIARNLYRAVFEGVAAEDQKGIVCADVPFGDIVNQSALQIVNELFPAPVLTAVRMYTKGVPSDMLLKKIFVHTALEIY